MDYRTHKIQAFHNRRRQHKQNINKNTAGIYSIKPLSLLPDVFDAPPLQVWTENPEQINKIDMLSMNKSI